MSWRDWSISVKLAAVTLVPILFAAALGAITISSQVTRSNNYERIDRLVALGGDVRTLVGAIQHERTETAALLTPGTVGSSPTVDLARADVDRAISPFNTDLSRAAQLDNGVAAAESGVRDQLGKLAGLRQQVTSGQVEVIQALDSYSQITGQLLAMDTTMVAEIGDNSIGSTPAALHSLQLAKEEISTSEALLGYGLSRNSLAPAQLDELRTNEVRLADRLDDFRGAATADQQQNFNQTVMGPDNDTRSRLIGNVLSAQGSGVTQAIKAISPQQWTGASNAVLGEIDTVSNNLGDQVSAASAGLVETSGTDAGLLAVLLFLALVVTAAVVFLITRQLLRSLRMLRASALDVADRQLPAAVRVIQEGQEQGTQIEPLAIGTTDEIGQVAQAFDAVHSQALRLAMEQATMRTGYSSVFVNLSRRSQSLVQRQLQLIERLERDEEDADQLATLFQLDHLATRMRRNNENLMVLSGAEPGRRSGQPVATADVLRAAVSEIEQYQRVVVQQPPSARIVGYAASDLMRLVAELLDNATAFSAPETQVTVDTRASENGGLVVDIVDKGIGMTEAEISEANARLNQAATVDLATSRRMGLFVVGRLAGRHNISVVLHGGKDIVGLRATVTVPAELVMDLQETTQTTPDPEPATQVAEALPRRRIVNGAGRPGGLANLAGTSGTLGDGAAAPGGWIQNGHSGVLPARTSSDVEISGTALFNPAPKRDEPSLPPAPPEPPVVQPKQEEEPPAGGLPAGKALFEANNSAPASEWWSPAKPEPTPPPPPLPEERETTPIFDETLSAWFRSDKPAPSRQAKPTPARRGESARPAEPPRPTPRPAEPVQSAEPPQPMRQQPEPVGEAGFAPAEPPYHPDFSRLDEPVEPASRAEYERLDEYAQPEEPVEDFESVQQTEPEPEYTYEDEPAQAVGEVSGTEPEQADAGWAFAADESWRTVQSVSQVEPSSYTEAGLPRRRRGEQLMPGSAGTSAGGDTPAQTPARPLPARNPADVRSRLSNFQKGVSRARHAAGDEPPAVTERVPEPETSTWQSTTSLTEALSPQPDNGYPEQTETGYSPRPETGYAAESAVPPATSYLPLPSSSGWPETRQSPVTGAGQAPSPQRVPPGSSLPQRRPKSVPPPEAPVPSYGQLPQRQPSAAETTAYTPVERGMLPQAEPATPPPAPLSWDDASDVVPSDSSGQLPQWGVEAALPQRQEAESPEPAASSNGETSWSFATDEGWRAVEAASKAAPTSFTAAGLPRRRRGEQLMPGTASTASGAGTGPKPSRDPQDVRGRLSSFQQGVQRGRHRTAHAVDSERETMEGE